VCRRSLVGCSHRSGALLHVAESDPVASCRPGHKPIRFMNLHECQKGTPKVAVEVEVKVWVVIEFHVSRSQLFDTCTSRKVVFKGHFSLAKLNPQVTTRCYPKTDPMAVQFINGNGTQTCWATQTILLWISLNNSALDPYTRRPGNAMIALHLSFGFGFHCCNPFSGNPCPGRQVACVSNFLMLRLPHQGPQMAPAVPGWPDNSKFQHTPIYKGHQCLMCSVRTE